MRPLVEEHVLEKIDPGLDADVFLGHQIPGVLDPLHEARLIFIFFVWG